MANLELANTIALYAIAVTLFGLMVSIWMHKKQLNIQAFISYTEKYDNLSAKMPDEWHKRYEDEQEVPSKKQLRNDKYRIYFHLCSQEFYLYINGLIEEDLWLIWQNEIERNLDTPLLRLVWPIFEEEFQSYKSFHCYVNKFQELGPQKGHGLAKTYNKANVLGKLKAALVPRAPSSRR